METGRKNKDILTMDILPKTQLMILNVLTAYAKYKGNGDLISIFLSAPTEMHVPMHLNERQIEYNKAKNEKWKYKVLLDRLNDDSEHFKILNEFFQNYFISSHNLENKYQRFFDKFWELEKQDLDETIKRLRSLE